MAGMGQTSSRAAAKACILAAIPIGAVGFLVPDTWAVVSIVANVAMLGVGGLLWWWGQQPGRAWQKLRRTGPARSPGESVAASGVGVYYDDNFRGPVFVENQRWRYQLTLSATSRIRRFRGRNRAQAASAGAVGQLTMVARDLTEVRELVESAERRSRREQLWWLIAGLAASVPIGVAVNLLTG